MNFQLFVRRFPVTVTIIAINAVIFILNQFGFLEYSVSQPGIFNIGTFLAHFSHYAFFHFLMNMFVCVQISPFIESRLSRTAYVFVLLSIWFLLVAMMFPFLKNPMLGFSGIMMGLMMFTIFLYRQNHQFAKSLLGWLCVNIAIGFLPQISFLGHFMGAIVGAIVFGGYFGIQKIKNSKFKGQK